MRLVPLRSAPAFRTDDFDELNAKVSVASVLRSLFVIEVIGKRHADCAFTTGDPDIMLDNDRLAVAVDFELFHGLIINQQFHFRWIRTGFRLSRLDPHLVSPIGNCVISD